MYQPSYRVIDQKLDPPEDNWDRHYETADAAVRRDIARIIEDLEDAADEWRRALQRSSGDDMADGESLEIACALHALREL